MNKLSLLSFNQMWFAILAYGVVSLLNFGFCLGLLMDVPATLAHLLANYQFTFA